MGLHKFGIQETLRKIKEEPELTAEEIEVLAKTRQLCDEKKVDFNRLIDKIAAMPK